ncbi:MAG: nitroreductase family protein [Paraglaciecola sp.]|uniref:nitroreductase family protein n=1 Tax=Paraglaciecola sp. TaxID=1920173 RepID=UPI003298B094
MQLKQKLKQMIQKSPLIWRAYFRVKTEILRITNLRYYWYDITQNYKAMNWRTSDPKRAIISSELIFLYHKLEKGLVMPGPKRLFGLEPARSLMEILNKWDTRNLASDPVYLGALGTLQSYHDRILEFNLDEKDVILSDVKAFLINHDCQRAAYNTPCKLMTIDTSQNSDHKHFKILMEARRSVRNFIDKPVPREILLDSISMAQLSPSACNRQPWDIKIVSDPEMKKKLLSHQNGNAGFGHLAPHIAVISADASCFFGVIEKPEPYIDGGLFSMSLILALKANNVSSCCLNWCVRPKTDKAAHKLLNLAPSQRIIMLMAIGYAPEDTSVPRSPRRDVNDIVSFI